MSGLALFVLGFVLLGVGLQSVVLHSDGFLAPSAIITGGLMMGLGGYVIGRFEEKRSEK